MQPRILQALGAVLGVALVAGAAWAISAQAHPLARWRAAAAASPAPGSTSLMPVAYDGEAPWGAAYFGAITLTDQDGQPVRFFDDLIKDKVVAINFIFTSCSASCSLETARLRQVAELMGERMGKDVFFYSISIDPLNDTPEVLKAYAQKFGVPAGWRFLTGKDADITLLRRKLGLYSDDDVGASLNDHGLSFIMGNQKTGRWMRSSPHENSHILATQIGSWLHNYDQPESGGAATDYANAPTSLPTVSRGEDLFRTRCAACHTIGAPAGTLAALRAIGPDLKGITRRRPKDWLQRWMKEPDKMLAAGDPVATALLAQYANVRMPNLRLGDLEVGVLLDYIDQASRSQRSAGRVDLE